jgi:hypothetical protein
MLMDLSTKLRELGSAEDGAILVITAVVLVTLLLVSAYAIDTGIWFVHRSHLQTQADAAAVAAAENFQFPCEAATEEAIKKTVHEYDGTTGPYNPQVAAVPTTSATYSSTAHNLISQINEPNFINQLQPNDAGLTGKPCFNSAIDVKLSETNLPSYFPFVNPKYITAQARVSIEQEITATGEPFAEPLPTPNTMTVELVDESNGDARVAGPLTLTPSSDRTVWTTAGGVPVTFNDSTYGGTTFALGLRVLMSSNSSTTCGAAGVTCYATDSLSPPIGVAYTRVWSNSGTPGLPLTAPVAPQAGHVTLAPTGAASCPNAPSGTFSNFVSSSSECTVAMSANMTFTSTGGTALSCSTASMTLKAGATTVTIACPSGGPNGTWVSSPVAIKPSSGPLNLMLSWKLTAGKKPAGGGVTGGNSTGECTTAKPCVGSFDGRSEASPEVVQRVYGGAYDSKTEATSHSGPIVGATVADATTGNEIMSIAKGTAKSVNITVNALGFQNSQSIPSPPVELSFGGNQGNAALECNGSEGAPELEKAVAEGCPKEYATTSAPNPPICSKQPPGLPVCAKENPGTGKLEKVLDNGMNLRINGSKNAKCVNPNRWAAPNTISQILAESPKDPRLIITLITDYGALGNGASEVPVRAFAAFYVTGWAGDPCISQPNGTSNGLAYTHDDDPGSSNTGVLLGHFIKYVNSSPTGTGSGQCNQNSFGDCIAVLTR